MKASGYSMNSEQEAQRDLERVERHHRLQCCQRCSKNTTGKRRVKCVACRRSCCRDCAEISAVPTLEKGYICKPCAFHHYRCNGAKPEDHVKGCEFYRGEQ